MTVYNDIFNYVLGAGSAPWRLDAGSPYISASKLFMNGHCKVSRPVVGSWHMKLTFNMDPSVIFDCYRLYQFAPNCSAPVLVRAPSVSAYTTIPDYHPGNVHVGGWRQTASPYPDIDQIGAFPNGGTAESSNPFSHSMGPLSDDYHFPPPATVPITVALFAKAGSGEISAAFTYRGVEQKSLFYSMGSEYDFSRIAIWTEIVTHDTDLSGGINYGSIDSILVADGMADADVQSIYTNYPGFTQTGNGAVTTSVPSASGIAAMRPNTSRLFPWSTGRISHAHILKTYRDSAKALAFHNLVKG